MNKLIILVFLSLFSGCISDEEIENRERQVEKIIYEDYANITDLKIKSDKISTWAKIGWNHIASFSDDNYNYEVFFYVDSYEEKRKKSLKKNWTKIG